MTLIKLAIVAACSSADGDYGRACTTTSEAVTKKIGLYQTAEQAEKVANKIALRMTKNAVGEEPLILIGSGYYVYKVIENRSIAFGIPTFGVCDSASNSIGLDSYRINMNWRF